MTLRLENVRAYRIYSEREPSALTDSHSIDNHGAHICGDPFKSNGIMPPHSPARGNQWVEHAVVMATYSKQRELLIFNMSIPERSFLAVLRLVRIKDRPNWDSWNPEYNGSNPAIPVPRELNPSARFRGQDDYIENCRMDAKDSSGTQENERPGDGNLRRRAYVNSARKLSSPRAVRTQTNGNEMGAQTVAGLKDIAGFWVGFCFWELNGFYSVTGHRVPELGSRDF
ncbi:hypothetical protein B0H13DRAFT_2278123 [Mycena leptocephala]|nr:hypothetical protein B0H13DRAFT_2278123 [Mycena leptocephala]